MKPRIAYKTLALFEECVARDQGNTFRMWQGRVLPHMHDAYRTDEDPFRSHLGASIVGKECPRAIWYDFRWATKPHFSGRMLRLFNRGHLEEGRIIALLLTIGCEVFQQDANGKQHRISWAEGHAGGSGDGMLLNCPDVEKDVVILNEDKTHSEDSFCDIVGPLKDYRKHLLDPHKYPYLGQSIRDSKLEHFVQMQMYMGKMKLPMCLYIAVNKNTDDIYCEIVLFDSVVFQQFEARGEKLVWMDTPPTKINASPGFFKCSWCDHKAVCHLAQKPERNCRTCRFSEPRADAQWYCRFHGKPVTVKEQLEGCSSYEVKPEI